MDFLKTTISNYLIFIWEFFWFPILAQLIRFQRIIAYIPILWNSPEWDNGYMLRVWAFTLDRHIEGAYGKHCHHIVSKRRIRRAKACAAALRRMANEEYDRWYLNELYKDFKDTDFFERLNRPRTKEEDKLSKKMWEMEQYLYKQDAELVGKFLQKEIRYLWD